MARTMTKLRKYKCRTTAALATRRALEASLALFLSAYGMAESARAQQEPSKICGVAYGDSKELTRYFEGNPKLQPLDAPASYKSFAEGQGQTWTLTQPGHYAHFSVVCRHVVQDGESFRVASDFACFASRADCDRLIADFQELDKQMTQEAKRMQGQNKK